MCGISVIINKKNTLATNSLVVMNQIISHRGPDDEGYLLWDGKTKLPDIYSGTQSAQSSVLQHNLTSINQFIGSWKVGFGHRRLSIIDLSPSGHQPMIYEHLSITYNGEVYNYLELKKELISMGQQFQTSSDTEVILHAWYIWGEDCLHRFNGMFSFGILDSKSQKVYLVRDRFGVKPMYYTNTDSYVAVGSEAKQLRSLPEYTFELDNDVAYQYLFDGKTDHSSSTFEKGIYQVLPGSFACIDLVTFHLDIKQWYKLPLEQTNSTESELIDQFKKILSKSVSLRMRADVPVGTCLSGGLDSSTIACLMQNELKQKKGNHRIQTVTSCYLDPKYDEWEYANHINEYVNAKPRQVFPSFDKLTKDFHQLLWHQDYPFGSTSIFNQWCVFEAAKEEKMTVMIDGQGADEQLAGYGGNDLYLYVGLLRKLKFATLWTEIKAYKREKKVWPIGFLLGSIQVLLPKFMVEMLPSKYRIKKAVSPHWLKDFGKNTSFVNPNNLNKSLIYQVLKSPLPSLLRYEDRNSMAFSIESRVPFMDVNLIQNNLSLPEHMVLRKGERKYILRKAFKGIVPDKILERRDKMGFVSAEEKWLKGEGRYWYTAKFEEVIPYIDFAINSEVAKKMLFDMQEGKIPYSTEIWRIICFGIWYKKQCEF